MENAEQALRLSPFDPLIFMPYVGLAWVHFFAGRFDEAAHAAGRAAQANPRFGIPWLVRAAALAKSGRHDEARVSAQRLIEVEPEFTVGGYVSRHTILPERLAMVAEALRRAGLPEE